MNELIVHVSKAFDEMFMKRLAIESQLFPTTEYIIVACVNSYITFYSQLSQVANLITPEEIGKNQKYLFSEITPLQIFDIVMFPLFGRMSRIISLHKGDPFKESVEKFKEMQFIVDFWERLASTYFNGNLTVYEMNGKCQILDESQLREIKKSMTSTSLEEIKEIKKVAANLQLLSFMDECETRMRISSHGPYPHENQDLVITEMIRFHTGESQQWPWSETKAKAPYSSIAFVYGLKDMDRIWFNDWGTMFTEPIDYSENIESVAILAQNKRDQHFDVLTLKELQEFNTYAQQALTEQFIKMAKWDRAKKIAAGALVYNKNFDRFTNLVGITDKIDWDITDDVRKNEYEDLVNMIGNRAFKSISWLLRPNKRKKKNPTFIPRREKQK